MKARVLALYLPQYHPIPENDEWWGKGFTEWTNVGKAKPLFKGHHQPHVPADLGYYDLRVAETRHAQADMARKYGIEGFVYWHYWFGNGKRLIERPFNEVLESGEPDFPFALAWANETWKGFAFGVKNRNTLIEQLYPGEEDYIAHFYAVLPAFKDKRYIKIDGKPLFMIYRPLENEQIKVFIKVWRKLARENGLEDIFFIGHNNNTSVSADNIMAVGVDAVNTVRLTNYSDHCNKLSYRIRRKYTKRFLGVRWVVSYRIMSKYFLVPEEDRQELIFPSVIPNWDHSPRSGREGLVLTDSTPELFEEHVRQAVEMVQGKEPEHRIVFIKSWNEWGEGNYMEPDLRWGHGYLEALERQIK